jgi:hypothetical protein
MRVHDHAAAAVSFYARPAAMTSAGRYAPLLEILPRDIPGLAAVAQGLLIHEHLAQAYGVTLSETDRASVHTRPAVQLLAQIVARDDRPLHIARAPAARLPGNCRHFTVLMVAMIRAQGTPARARCGFGGYFGTGMFEDHWVCEYCTPRSSAGSSSTRRSTTSSATGSRSTSTSPTYPTTAS